MTRNQLSGRYQFEFKEWVAIAAALVGIFGTFLGGVAAWYDMRERHSLAVYKLDGIVDVTRDHEVRIRNLEVRPMPRNMVGAKQ